MTITVVGQSWEGLFRAAKPQAPMSFLMRRTCSRSLARLATCWRHAGVMAQQLTGHAPLRAGRWVAVKENTEGTRPSVLLIAYVILPVGRSECGWAQVEGILRKALPGNLRFPLALEVVFVPFPLCPQRGWSLWAKIIVPLALWLHFGPQDKEVSSDRPVPL